MLLAVLLQYLPQHELAPPLSRTACVALRALEQACRSSSYDWPSGYAGRHCESGIEPN